MHPFGIPVQQIKRRTHIHIEGWHVWVGGTGALGLVIGTLKWLFSALNGKANVSTVKTLFAKVDDNVADIADLKTNVATTKVKVENIEATVGKMDSKLDRLLDRPL